MQLNILILAFPKDTCCHRKGESAPAMEQTKKTKKQRFSWIFGVKKLLQDQEGRRLYQRQNQRKSSDNRWKFCETEIVAIQKLSGTICMAGMLLSHIFSAVNQTDIDIHCDKDIANEDNNKDTTRTNT